MGPMAHDALVIGGGLAGSAVGAELSRAGLSVMLVEKEAAAHDKVCGEFLSHEAVHYLRRLGLEPEALGSVPIERVRLTRGNRRVTAKLPFQAQSLSRRVLDEAMLSLAERAGAEIRRGVRVTSLSAQNSLWTATVSDGPSLTARAAFLATGKHDVRGRKRPAGLQNNLIGFKIYWRLSPRQSRQLEGAVELALFEGGYAGLQPVEGRRANLCLLVHERSFGRAGRSWSTLLGAIRKQCPHLDERLEGAEPCSDRPLAISSIPFGYVLKRSTGPWHLGDQAAVIPSFAGDGMSIALHSARLAARHYLLGHDADAFQAELGRNVTRPIWLSTWLSRALLTSLGQRAAMGLSRLAPALLVGTAHSTRIPRAALARAADH